MTMPTDSAATRAALAVGLASGSRTLDAWSRLLAGLAGIGLLLPAPVVPLWKPLLVFILLTGLGQLYFAARIALDRSVFVFWAARWRGEGEHERDLAAFDQALVELRVRRASSATRSLVERVAGLRRLLIRQLFLLILQMLALLVLCILAR